MEFRRHVVSYLWAQLFDDTRKHLIYGRTVE
jgi:hypothetical protein